MSEFLKCDNETCGIRHDVGTITEDMIGMPCPECGSDMLTREDWEFYKAVVRPSMDIMIALGLAKEGNSTTPDNEKVWVNGHNGEVRMKLPTPPSQPS